MAEQLQTPIAFCVFNRPHLTARVLAAIRAARPGRLYVVADGPRPEHAQDRALVGEVRALIETGVDWPCEIRRVYAEENLGCARRIASGLDAVFSEEEEAIILEDDCLPLASFFPYCEELLERYRDDQRIGVVAANNHQYRELDCAESYYFSIYNNCWGWATWRRAWCQFDFSMSGLASWSDERLRAFAGGRPIWKYWRNTFRRTAQGEIDTWDYRWTFACWSHGLHSILPRRSLVTNLGFGPESTHTKQNVYSRRACPIEEMKFPMIHPRQFAVNEEADRHTESIVFSQPNLLVRAFRKVRRMAAGSRL